MSTIPQSHRRRIATLIHRLYSSFSTTPKTSTLYTTDSPDSTTIQLLSWGKGASGQLGGGVEETRLYPSPVTNLLLPPKFTLFNTPGLLPGPEGSKNVVKVGISCGLFHSCLVVDGGLWVWGKGDGGRLGLGHENSMFVPTLNPHLDNVRGYGGFGALGHSVYTRELFPRLVKGAWEGTIKHIATSGAHTAAVTESGELYIWGREEGDGRLGLGPGRGPDHAGGLSIPCKVKELPFPVAAVSCGGFFTLALTEEGQLWNWGANSNYELGRGDRIGGWKPRPVPSLEKVRIIQVASGGYHSLALTDDGKVLSWGHGGQGQLGHGSVESQKIPTLIEALAHEHITYICCGGSTSAAVTDKGKLYMWGNASDSQLGVPGLPAIQPFPVEVNFLMEDDGLGPHKVLSIANGASHAMCLALRESC